MYLWQESTHPCATYLPHNEVIQLPRKVRSRRYTANVRHRNLKSQVAEFCRLLNTGMRVYTKLGLCSTFAGVLLYIGEPSRTATWRQPK